jgi:hypothetical protein
MQESAVVAISVFSRAFLIFGPCSACCGAGIGGIFLLGVQGFANFVAGILSRQLSVKKGDNA